ncbi:MAG: hypothetical protein ACLQIQ_16415 [Beijerinckiaceae bacterium]
MAHRLKERALWPRARCATGRAAPLDHDDFGLNPSKIMNVIDSKDLERDMQISLRNLRELDCAGKPASTFSHPTLRNGYLEHCRLNAPRVALPAVPINVDVPKEERSLRHGSVGGDENAHVE